MQRFGLEGTIKLLQFQPPAMGRDTFHGQGHLPLEQLAPSPVSNLALNTARAAIK